jgi:hypothetical protein
MEVTKNQTLLNHRESLQKPFIMNNNAKVIVSTDDNGGIIRVSKNNPEFGYIRLEQTRTALGMDGWVKVVKLSSLLLGSVEALESLGITATDKMPGKIIIKESLTPFNAKDPDRDLKMAGNTGIVCSINDKPIYRKTFYLGDSSAQDILLSHDNSDAIREANGYEPKAVKAIMPAEAFGFDDSEEGVKEAELTESPF